MSAEAAPAPGAPAKKKSPLAVAIVIGLAVALALFGGQAGVAVAVLLVAGVLGSPLFALIGAIAAVMMVFDGADEAADFYPLVENMVRLGDNQALLAVPLFIMSGALMAEGEISKKLIAFAQAVVGWVPGGLAMSAVLACVFYAAISGSSPATVIAIGTMMGPTLVKAKYGERFAHGLLTSAGSLGILIPPSIPMILYPIVNQKAFIQVERLFMAGYGPGLLLAAILMGACFVAGVRRREEDGLSLGQCLFRGGLFLFFPLCFFSAFEGGLGLLQVVVQLAVYFTVIGRLTDFRFAAVLRTGVDGFWALLFPFAIYYGIQSGIFNAVEAAALSVIYAVVVEVFIYRSLRLWDAPRIFQGTGVLLGSLLVIMVTALAFAGILEERKVPEQLIEAVASLDLSYWQFLLLLNGLLLLVGMAMDILSAMFVFVPLLWPIAASFGMDPMHFGIVFIVNLEIGYLTPPIGLNLFVASTLFERSLGHMMKAVVPFIGLMIVGLGIVTYVPAVSVGLAYRLLGEEPPPAATATGDGSRGDDVGGALDDDEGALDEDDDRGEGVLTLEEMMQLAEDEDAEEGAGEDRVLTLEEMMELAEEQDAAGGDEGSGEEADDAGGEEAAPEAPPDPGRPLTLEEMMEQAGVE